MSVLNNKDSEFEKQGVRFKIITEDMYDAAKEFYWKHFIPDEPISRYTIYLKYLYVKLIMCFCITVHSIIREPLESNLS